MNDPRRFKAPFIPKERIWQETDTLRAAHPAGRALPVQVLDLAEFDLGLDLVPVNGLREQLQSGTYRITPRFGDLMQLGIGSVGGKIRAEDLESLRQRLRQKVQVKRRVTELSSDDEQRIDVLIDSIAKHPDQIHYDSVLEEGFRPRALSKEIKVQMKCGSSPLSVAGVV